MSKWRSRFKVTAIFVSTVLAITALIWAGMQPRSPLPITTEEARDTFAHIQSAVISPDGPLGAQSVCNDWAADMTLCLQSMEQYGATSPIDEVELIASSTLADGTARVDVVGRDRDGRSFRSALQLVRVGDLVKAVDPVYWYDRELVDLTWKPALD